MNKPNKGIIENWWVEYIDAPSLTKRKRKVYVIRGYGFVHPTLGPCHWFHTSQVITRERDIREGATVETLNSVYTLGKPREKSTI